MLKAISAAIDNFPDGTLRLDSAPILSIRSSHVCDQTYIDILRKIFPLASTPFLSTLTAWLLVDIYFTRIWEQSPPLEQLCGYAVGSDESLCRIPDKAREMLGIGLRGAAQIRPDGYALRKRARAIHADIGVIGQQLIGGIERILGRRYLAIPESIS